MTLVITFKLYSLRKKAFQYNHKNYCPVCPSTKMLPETVLLSVELKGTNIWRQNFYSSEHCICRFAQKYNFLNSTDVSDIRVKAIR